MVTRYPATAHRKTSPSSLETVSRLWRQSWLSYNVPSFCWGQDHGAYETAGARTRRVRLVDPVASHKGKERSPQ